MFIAEMSSILPTFSLAVFLKLLILCSGQRHPIRDALYLGNQTLSEEGNADCVWRRGGDRDECPDPDIFFNLYTPAGKYKMEILRQDWLRTSGWQPSLETILLIHGYAGGDDTLPIIVLRDAYLRADKYNVIMVDWGALCKPPCYVAAVHNLRPVARCLSAMLEELRAQGLPPGSVTCVGHSLGAHLCGIMANYLPFRLNRIIGLDPARPLVRNGANLRLDAGDANSVQVLHTNAGKYGEGGRLGHLDVCINGGRSQPYCANTPNEALCSHIWSICYQAESLFKPRLAEPCARRCPVGARPSVALPGSPLHIGQHAPPFAAGTYCVHNEVAPFCPQSDDDMGDPRCCLTEAAHAGAIKNMTRFKEKPLRRMRQIRKRKQLGKLLLSNNTE